MVSFKKEFSDDKKIYRKNVKNNYHRLTKQTGQIYMKNTDHLTWVDSKNQGGHWKDAKWYESCSSLQPHSWGGETSCEILYKQLQRTLGEWKLTNNLIDKKAFI